jgi:hypothetical protein
VHAPPARFDHLLTPLFPAVSREYQTERSPKHHHEPRNAFNAAANAAASCCDRRAVWPGCRPAKSDPTQLSGQVRSSRRWQMRGHSAGIRFCAGQQHDQDVGAGAASRSDTSAGVRGSCMIYTLLQHVRNELLLQLHVCIVTDWNHAPCCRDYVNARSEDLHDAMCRPHRHASCS